MLNVLLTIHIIITVAMVLVILIQRTSSDGLSGLSGSSSGSLFSGRTSANLLTRTTAILAVVFMGNSLLMAALTARDSNLIDELTKEKPAIEQQETTGETPAAPTVPLAE